MSADKHELLAAEVLEGSDLARLFATPPESEWDPHTTIKGEPPKVYEVGVVLLYKVHVAADSPSDAEQIMLEDRSWEDWLHYQAPSLLDLKPAKELLAAPEGEEGHIPHGRATLYDCELLGDFEPKEFVDYMLRMEDLFAWRSHWLKAKKASAQVGSAS